MSDWDRSAGPPPEAATGTGVFLQVGLGLALVPLMHLVAGVVLAGFAGLTSGGLQGTGWDGVGPMIGMAWFMGIGVAQLAYVLPAVGAAWFVRRPLALGLVIGAALTFVLNTACYGVMFGSIALSSF